MAGINRMSGPAGWDSSATLRRSLGRRLKALREAAGKGKSDIPNVGSRTKIGRLEDGRGPFKPPDMLELCRVYGVSEEETQELFMLAERTKEERIWDDYTDLLPGSFGMLVDLEVTANKITMYEPDVMPGLLQTPEYARAVFEAVCPPLAASDIERLVAVRTQRQHGVFSGPSKARIQAVLNEAILAREVGGQAIAAAQLEHVRELNATSRVDVRVLTYRAGAHPAMRGSFTMLEFADPAERRVVYVESSAGARLLDKEGQFAEYRAISSALIKQSTPLKEYTA